MFCLLIMVNERLQNHLQNVTYNITSHTVTNILEDPKLIIFVE